MASNYSILVGTTGAGLFQSPDGGENWSRIRDPFPGESQIRALAKAPTSYTRAPITGSTAVRILEVVGRNWTHPWMG